MYRARPSLCTRSNPSVGVMKGYGGGVLALVVARVFFAGAASRTSRLRPNRRIGVSSVLSRLGASGRVCTCIIHYACTAAVGHAKMAWQGIFHGLVKKP